MSWHPNWPITAASYLGAWDVIIDLWIGTGERAKAATPAGSASRIWPKRNMPWEEGVITGVSQVTVGGVTYTQFQDATKTWSTTPKRWVDWDPSPALTPPPHYDIIITDCDPKKVVRTPIIDQIDDHTVNGTDLTQRVTERVIPSIASLNGKKYYIIGRGQLAGWSERIPEWPNDRIWGTGITDSAVAGTIMFKRAVFKDNPVGYDILFFNSAQVLQRGRVTARTATSITFTGTTGIAVATERFFLVAVDGLFQWDYTHGPRIAGPLFAPHRGAKDSYWSHRPLSENLEAVSVPKLTTTIQQGAVGFPPTDTIFVLGDEDPLTPFDDGYNPDILLNAGYNLADWMRYDVAKGFRFVQAEILRIMRTGTFILPSWGGGSQSPFNGSVATLFNYAGINSQSATSTGHDGAGLNVSLTVPWTPIRLEFAVIGTSGEVMFADSANYDGTQISGSFFTTDHDGKTVVVTLGYGRMPLKDFERFDAATVFVADVDLDGNAVDPPTEAFPGEYVTFPASTHYRVATDAGTTGESTEARDAIAAGDIARYVGQQFADPTTPDLATASPSVQTIYRDHGVDKLRAPRTQKKLNQAKSGKATGGGLRFLIDTKKDWYNVDFYGSDVVRYETGTFTSGSTTSGTDTTKAGNAFWEGVERGERWIDFPVEVIVNPGDLIVADNFDDPAAIVEKRLIVSHTGASEGGTTVGFNGAFSVSVNGLPYRIPDLKRLRRYKGRPIKLRKPDLANPGMSLTTTATIAGNADDHQFFTADLPWPIDDTTTYTITDPTPGGIWKRNAGNTAWDKPDPTTTDPRQPHPYFHANQSENLADKLPLQRYGLMCNMDAGALEVCNQLYTLLNVMQKTAVIPTYTSDSTGGTTYANNLKEADLGGEVVRTWATAGSDLSDAWDAATATASPATPPHAQTVASEFKSDGDFSTGVTSTASATRAFSYAQVDLATPACPIIRNVTTYIYPTIDGADHGDGEITYDDESPGLDGSEISQREYHFNANGDGVSFRHWSPIGTQTGTTAERVVSAIIGNAALPLPAYPAEPTTHAANVIRRGIVQGWYANGVVDVIDWQFDKLNTSPAPEDPLLALGIGEET